ncbi:high-affinity branched-chain amino acid ABC transporter ATP-binding protein LivG [Sansalvadorimonas sp. 2012CJ34-2]|uniref:High-affinity branched-chain amino acid ABC transporter ATP-binding protein LivG n=1 Tax=Parendozoicomonas callyspongiae TaxID=2942213 RepID=A0ABT0PCY1_9GAMM|nr:high-affinity branched-chain amino acid ABC transporter ATP-binding protein LivG [Sansalvadorimonas sp. 2012CJ34-2]MCL6269238.1 high-affinity branched-chain amino acid ABC transporter ATP-binding protein LivG [Sansalvadorimonas sp. 2012CJ34-2]
MSSQNNNQNASLLEVEELTMRFGGLLAVDSVALSIQEGQITSIIGPNGAGKTTVFNCLTGFYKPTAGSIRFKGEDIAGNKNHEISRKGIVRTFQHVRLFKNMTVLENLLVAQHRHINTNLLSGLLKTSSYRRTEQEALDHAAYWLERVDLADMANRDACNLAYGQQRRLEIARCMVTRPTLLMLDEPAAGLNPKETAELDELISDLRSNHNVSVLLIEHDMKLVMGISDYIYVINQGTPLAEGKPEDVSANDDVIKAYLGEA